ncbi:MAG: hypothetical protein VX017_10915, partial [Pseudomonadota bacterium]|nr:hypothetical protein [Pseudomonadota bacterium]
MIPHSEELNHIRYGINIAIVLKNRLQACISLAEHLDQHAQSHYTAWTGRMLTGACQKVDAALSAAFISPKCGRANTGYVGPSLPAIDAALKGGNIREVWGLMYVLTKTHYFTSLMKSLLGGAARDAELLPQRGVRADHLPRHQSALLRPRRPKEVVRGGGGGARRAP